MRLWHFLALPTLAMPMVILGFELLERLAGIPRDHELYGLVRTIVISAAMAGLIGVLAYNYRRRFEIQLAERNRDLEATRDFLTAIIQGSGEGVITCDEEDRVISWNRAAEAIYGFTSEEMTDRRIAGLFGSRDPGRVEWEAMADRLRAGETVRHFQAEQVRKDGRHITVDITRSPLVDAKGRHRGSVSLVDDVSEIKEMERRLRRQERLAAVGQLAASVAHEIKNPLAGIRGACEIIDGKLEAGAAEKELTAEVLREVDRLNRTVTDLLDFARPRVKHAVSSDLHEILDAVVALALEDPRARNVVIERDYDDALPRVKVDPHQMEQVFLNLLLNAFQAVDYRGRVRLATHLNARFAVVRVADDGCGVEPGSAQRIFEPFFTTRARGSGLGLAIVRNLVGDHGGRIELAESEGRGAAFDVFLPMER